MTLNPLMHLANCRLSATVKLTSNGDGAKTAKVNIVANSGSVMDYDGMPLVFDFDGMVNKDKIPLDWEHGQSIGYLNKFDTSTGALQCKGILVIEDSDCVKVSTIAAQMLAGVPYEASIEGWPDGDVAIEYVPEGVTTVVNQQSVSGPVYILREWALKAVALCKFGKDANTSVSIQMSDKKKDNQEKGYLIRLSKPHKGTNAMNTENDDKQVDAVAAVEATPAEVKADEVKIVEAEVVEAPEVTQASQSAEVKEAETPVDDKVEQAVEAQVAVEAVAAPVVEAVKASAAVEAKDPRAEYKAFKAKFGDKAGEYFEAGHSLADATEKHLVFLATALADANKRLAAINRGGAQPIKFSESAIRESAAVKLTPKDLIRLNSK